jgi:broad specificity phosphatase PhoE
VTVELVYETHCFSTDNEAGIATGWRPGELSAQGRINAQALGDRRRDDGIDVVYTSDLRRAIETAEIAFAGSPIPLVQDARLREVDYGDWTGMPVDKLHETRPDHIDTPFPGGQSYRQATAAHEAFLADLRRERDGQRVLVIAHAATRYALMHLFDGMPLERAVVAPFDWQPGWEYVLA